MKKLYAGQKKVANDIDKALKRELSKDSTKSDAIKKAYYYSKILNKNKQNKK